MAPRRTTLAIALTRQPPEPELPIWHPPPVAGPRALRTSRRRGFRRTWRRGGQGRTPCSLPLAAGGLLLVTVGANYERRRRDLRLIRTAVKEMR